MARASKSKECAHNLRLCTACTSKSGDSARNFDFCTVRTSALSRAEEFPAATSPLHRTPPLKTCFSDDQSSQSAALSTSKRLLYRRARCTHRTKVANRCKKWHFGCTHRTKLDKGCMRFTSLWLTIVGTAAVGLGMKGVLRAAQMPTSGRASGRPHATCLPTYVNEALTGIFTQNGNFAVAIRFRIAQMTLHLVGQALGFRDFLEVHL